MAVQKPIVIVAGQTGQIPVGDTLPLQVATPVGVALAVRQNLPLM